MGVFPGLELTMASALDLTKDNQLSKEKETYTVHSFKLLDRKFASKKKETKMLNETVSISLMGLAMILSIVAAIAFICFIPAMLRYIYHNKMRVLLGSVCSAAIIIGMLAMDVKQKEKILIAKSQARVMALKLKSKQVDEQYRRRTAEVNRITAAHNLKKKKELEARKTKKGCGDKPFVTANGTKWCFTD